MTEARLLDDHSERRLLSYFEQLRQAILEAQRSQRPKKIELVLVVQAGQLRSATLNASHQLR